MYVLGKDKCNNIFFNGACAAFSLLAPDFRNSCGVALAWHLCFGRGAVGWLVGSRSVHGIPLTQGTVSIYHLVTPRFNEGASSTDTPI